MDNANLMEKFFEGFAGHVKSAGYQDPEAARHFLMQSYRLRANQNYPAQFMSGFDGIMKQAVMNPVQGFRLGSEALNAAKNFAKKIPTKVPLSSATKAPGAAGEAAKATGAAETAAKAPAVEQAAAAPAEHLGVKDRFKRWWGGDKAVQPAAAAVPEGRFAGLGRAAKGVGKGGLLLGGGYAALKGHDMAFGAGGPLSETGLGISYQASKARAAQERARQTASLQELQMTPEQRSAKMKDDRMRSLREWISEQQERAKIMENMPKDKNVSANIPADYGAGINPAYSRPGYFATNPYGPSYADRFNYPRYSY